MYICLIYEVIVNVNLKIRAALGNIYEAQDSVTRVYELCPIVQRNRSNNSKWVFWEACLNRGTLAKRGRDTSISMI